MKNNLFQFLKFNGTFLMVVLLIFNQAFAQQKNIISKRIDSILINTGQKFLVKAEIKSKDFSKVKDCEVCEPSTYSLIIKDYNNHVLLNRVTEPVDDASSETPFSLNLKGVGNVLAIQITSSPSLASDQGDLLLYTINSSGKLQAITNSISISGNFDDGSLFRVNRFGNPLCPKDSFPSEKHFCLQTVNFISYCGFNICKFYKLDLDGYKKSAIIENDTIPIYISKSNSNTFLKKDDNSIQLTKLGSAPEDKLLTVYSVPKSNAVVKKLGIQKNMLIRFNYILHYTQTNEISDNDFIQINMNGQVYYLKGYAELPKLGFPNCD